MASSAAYLGAASFLRAEMQGRRVLDWIRGDNQDFQSALHENPDTAREWMQTLRGLTDQPTDKPVSHSLAKQVYWLAGEDPRSDSGYHLLQPMFPSSLVHAVHAYIQNTFFSEVKIGRAHV